MRSSNVFVILKFVALQGSYTQASSLSSECLDNPNFRTKLGLSCSVFGNIHCNKIAQFFKFTLREKDHLFENCRYSCGVCQTLPSQAPSPTQTAAPTESCRDAPSYRDKYQSPCQNYVGLACKRMSILGLDQYEIQDLIDSCQESCGMCTLPPSMLPSSVPSTEKPSSSPTAGPSHAPTHFPSLVLSGSPSDLPSERPVASPSTRPSMVPSLVPSMFPSSAPSISSSAAPSEAPSSNPSNSCHDVASFRNRIGRACTDFSNTMPCENYISLGFSHNDVYQLLANCPHTCGICEPIIRPSLLVFISDNRPSQEALVQKKRGPVPKKSATDSRSTTKSLRPVRQPTLPPTFPPTPSPTLSPTPEHGGLTIDPDALSQQEIAGQMENFFSFAGPDGRACEDSVQFRTHMGLSCHDHKNLQCLDIQSIGFTPNQMLQLLWNCPKTCGLCLT